MATVRIEEPAQMNVLGLFLAEALRRNLVERAKPCRLSGVLEVRASGMRAAVRFDSAGASVTRAPERARARVEGSLCELVEALVRPGLGKFLRVKSRGNRLFLLRVLPLLAP